MSVIEQNNAQIERLRSAIAEAYAACDEKEATMPSDEVIANLASCIRSIQHGIPDGYVIPSGSVNITTNGSHSVSGKATANVNVPNTLVTARERQTPTSNVRTLTFNIDLDGATPNVIFVFAENLTSLNSTDTLIDACYDESEGFILSKYSSAASTLANTGSSNIEFDVSTIGKIKVTVSNSYFRSGVQYYCRAWA